MNFVDSFLLALMREPTEEAERISATIKEDLNINDDDQYDN